MDFGIKPGDSIVINGTTWNKFTVLQYLEHNKVFLERGILLIYSQQDADEQSQKGTTKENGRGFNRDDGYLLSIYAGYCKNRTSLEEGKRLTDGERNIAREKMKKYAGQILRLMIARHKAEQEKQVTLNLTLNINLASTILGNNLSRFYLVLDKAVHVSMMIESFGRKFLKVIDNPVNCGDGFLHFLQIITNDPNVYLSEEEFQEGATFRTYKENLRDEL